MPRVIPGYYYKNPKLVKAARGWYIEYSYRIPNHLREHYNNKIWWRFRIKKGINRMQGMEKSEFAEWLLDEIKQSLREGYNPFQTEKRVFEEIDDEEDQSEKDDDIYFEDAVSFFLTTWKKRGLDESTIGRYKRTADYLKDWFEAKKILHIDVKRITPDHIQNFLNDKKEERGWSNREYNNQFDFTRTIFNFFVKKKFIPDNLMSEIPKQKTKSTKHRYYDSVTLPKITKAMEVSDAYILFAFQTVYYLCIRAEKEMMNFKIENIKWGEDRVLLEFGKGNSERYIPLDKNIKKIFLKRKLDKYPQDYYVFGIEGKPSARPFGKGFLSKRFRKVRNLAEISSKYTLYSAKHTRVIHLKQDGLSDADIMALTGHKDFAAYAKYLRDLGIDADPKKINLVSRKITGRKIK